MSTHKRIPGSARLGIKSGELDVGWLVLRGLQKVHLVWNISTPENLPERKERIAVQ